MASNWYLGTMEAARILDVAPSTVHRWGSIGRLPFLVEDGRHLFPFDVVAKLGRRLRAEAALLTPEDVGRMFGISSVKVRSDTRKGRLPRQNCILAGYKYAWADVVRYWREHLRGVCVRCTILGEATPERGFMCEACEYEHRTGRIYHWPCCPPARNGDMRGRLALRRGGNGGAAY